MTDRDFSQLQATIQKSVGTLPQQEVLMKVLAALAIGDGAALAPLFSDDVELHIFGFAPVAGSWRGKDEVIAASLANFGKLTEQQPAMQAMIQQEGTIALHIHETGKLKSDGTRYEVEGVVWLTFHNAQVKRIEEFMHTH